MKPLLFILAHESAMNGGAILKLPEWTFSS